MAGLSASSLFSLLLGGIAIAQVYAASPVPVNVEGPARNAVPILLQAQDYEGPYDPWDPRGMMAAQHRAAVVNGKNNFDFAASYVPPGAFEMLSKDLMKVFKNEAKRFTIAHPVETAELAGVATKLATLVKTAAHKVKSEERKDNFRDRFH